MPIQNIKKLAIIKPIATVSNFFNILISQIKVAILIPQIVYCFSFYLYVVKGDIDTLF